jgi:hypothetical protein
MRGLAESRPVPVKHFSMLRRSVPKMVLGLSKGEQAGANPEPELSRR